MPGEEIYCIAQILAVIVVEILIVAIKYIKWLRINGKLMTKKTVKRMQFMDAMMDRTPEREKYKSFSHYFCNRTKEMYR